MSFGGERDAFRRKVFTRRAVVLGAAGAGAFVGLGARLYQLQIIEQDQYATLSDDNRFFHQLVAPSRGLILDRYGRVIAGNVPNYQVFVLPDQIEDPDAAAHALLTHLDPQGRVSVTRRARLAQRIHNAARHKPMLVAQNLDWETFARVNFHRPDLPGVSAQVGETRAYGLETSDGARRDADAFAHVVGYVARPNDTVIDARLSQARTPTERQRMNRELRHPGFRVGRAGLEYTQDQRLQGRWGELRVEVDARGRVVREVGLDQKTRAGGDVQLTLDAEIQAFAQQRLYGESGAVVAMDVETGEILCLASAPAFDPNLFVEGIHPRAYNALRNDERAPLYNKPLAGLYAPGSTFKMMTALAALRAGVMTPTDTVYCNGRMRVGDRVFHCWRREGHGSVDLRRGIKESCDTYFYEAAARLYRGAADGEDPLAEEAARFGLGGSAFPLAAPGARAGVVPTNRWKLARRNEPMTLGDRLNVAIGQGYALASPLELAVMTATLAHGRRLVRPRILADAAPTPREGERPEDLDAPLDVDSQALALIREAMTAVVHEVRGTAYWALGTKGLDVPGVLMAGKTGTSQVRRITLEERARGVTRNEDLPWRRRDHGLFVAYAPVDRPRYAVALIVEHGGGGSSAAAPPARDILKRLLERDPRPVAGRENPFG